MRAGRACDCAAVADADAAAHEDQLLDLERELGVHARKERKIRHGARRHDAYLARRLARQDRAQPLDGGLRVRRAGERRICRRQALDAAQPIEAVDLEVDACGPEERLRRAAVWREVRRRTERVQEPAGVSERQMRVRVPVYLLYVRE